MKKSWRLGLGCHHRTNKAAQWLSEKLHWIKRKILNKTNWITEEWKCFAWPHKSQFVLQQAGGSVSAVQAGRQSVMVWAVFSWHTRRPLIASLGCHSVPEPRCWSGAATSCPKVLLKEIFPGVGMGVGRKETFCGLESSSLTCTISCNEVKWEKICSNDILRAFNVALKMWFMLQCNVLKKKARYFYARE